ncbi:hypothetical protein [Tatumella sp. UBA2305]|nr:hypothetical protein [Tatumella sp. UBA2305]
MQASTLSAVGSFTLLAVAGLTIMVGCILVPGLPESQQPWEFPLRPAG